MISLQLEWRNNGKEKAQTIEIRKERKDIANLIETNTQLKE